MAHATTVTTRARIVIVALLVVSLGACDGDRSVPSRVTEGGAAGDVDRTSWGGAEIYDEVCDKCHKMGVDGAPELGDAAAWGPRIDKGRDVLLRHVFEGFKEMPARGDCDFCTDDQLDEALGFMLERSGTARASP